MYYSLYNCVYLYIPVKIFYDNHLTKIMFSAIKLLLILKRLINDTTKNTLIKYNLSPPNSTVKLVCWEYN